MTQLKLWKQYENVRDGYTKAKTELIRRCTAAAKAEFPERYR